MHSIVEILLGVAQDFNDNLLYTVDELSNASIEISAESTDITDKKGNVVRRIWKTKTGTFNSQNAFLHPALMNAASGSKIAKASVEDAIRMPKMLTMNAGETIDVADAVEGTIHVMGLFGNGGNDVEIEQGTEAVVGESYALVDNKLTVPAAGTDAPTTYVVRYERDVNSGIKLTNVADKFPDTVKFTLQCAYADPCSDTLKPVYCLIPSFMPDPSMTINLDVENQEMDFNGTLQMDYCSGKDKVLYVFYYPDEDITEVGVVVDDGEETNPSNP